MSSLANRDKFLMDWRAKKATLEAAKKAELEARLQIVEMLHDPSRSGSTETTDLGQGYKLKIKVPVYYGFVKDADGDLPLDKIEHILETIENDSEYGKIAAQNIIRWKPELSVTEYKNLQVKYRLLIDDVLVTSEGTPSVELIEP